jgi:NAD(P) transhydrogenase subunit alpha
MASQIFADLPINLIIFILSTVLGIELIRHVSRLLHTPLMSLTNAISSVSFVAALIVMSETNNTFIVILATVGVGLAFTNIVSGFLITERILRMFRPKRKEEGAPSK